MAAATKTRKKPMASESRTEGDATTRNRALQVLVHPLPRNAQSDKRALRVDEELKPIGHIVDPPICNAVTHIMRWRVMAGVVRRRNGQTALLQPARKKGPAGLMRPTVQLIRRRQG